MKILTFKNILELYSQEILAKEDCAHKEGQVREKFTEIADAVGMDLRLLRQYRKSDGTMYIGKKATAPFRFPETSADFVVHVLVHHTDADYQNLRRADYRAVPVSTMTYLIEGFAEMLKGLGHDEETILRQKHSMEFRMNYKVRAEREKLDKEIESLNQSLNQYEDCLFGMNYDDRAFFFSFICARMKDFHSYMAELHDCYCDTRQEELTDLAQEEAASMDDADAMLEINQSLILADALEKDTKYQNLLKRRTEILGTYDFVKKQKGEFDKIVSDMNEISRKHEIELFGKELPPEPDAPLTLKHPAQVLQESIAYVEESRESRRKFEEERAKITPEQQEAERKMIEAFCKERGLSLPGLEPDPEKSK